MPYIRRWAEGLAKQTFRDRMKILIIDNCSTDGSFEVMQQCVEEFNLPAEIIQNEKNIGLMGSVKKAYRMLDTKYFAVLDPDDFYISPQKVEKAVKFLEKHEDYSGYACNQILESKNGNSRICFDANIPSQTFTKMQGSPFFQTASTTFKNCFTPELLNWIDEFTGDAKSHAFDSDGFRNMLFYNFGKVYFENSPDSNWLVDVGMWGTLSKIEQDLANMESHYIYFNFCKKVFGLNETAINCLNLSVTFYARVLDDLNVMFKNFSAHEFKYKNSSAEGTEDLNSIFDKLKKHCKIFSDIKGGKLQ